LGKEILKNQNDDEAIQLLRASTVAYGRAKMWENIVTFVLLFLSFAYPIFYSCSDDDQMKLILFQVSFFLYILVQVFSPSLKGNTSQGALIKEEFDTKIFGLPWKSTLKRIDAFEISKLSNNYNGKPIKDWYPTNFSDKIPNQILIATCQRCNTAWDIELRNKYSSFLFAFIILYTVAFGLLIVFKNLDGKTVFFICFSTLSFYTHFVTIIRGHRSVIEKRTAINSILDKHIFGSTEPTMQELRDIQDEIYLTRQESVKVPDLFFRIFSRQTNNAFDNFLERVNKHFGK